jgi:hypothetical protein
MATAFFLPLSNLFAPLQALAAWFAPAPARAASDDLRTPPPRQPGRQLPARRLPGQGPVKLPTARPLRVMRVVEPSAPRAIAGRMVISGRLADVCAELDRMAAQEAASAARR